MFSQHLCWGLLCTLSASLNPGILRQTQTGGGGVTFLPACPLTSARPTGPAPAQIRCPNRSAELGVLGAFVSFMMTTAMIFWLMMMMLQQTCWALTSPQA